LPIRDLKSDDWTLQTLINTYPDSEYLSKAKLAMRIPITYEGGVSGFTQAEADTRIHHLFSPLLGSAGSTVPRGNGALPVDSKSDRDQTEALLAESEFKEFLLKYPDSP